jgi:acyl carrier protein
VTFLEARKRVLQALDAATDIFHDVHFNRRLDDPAIDQTFSELELDSLSIVQCCQALEEDTQIDIDPADLAVHNSVNQLAWYLAERTSVA